MKEWWCAWKKSKTANAIAQHLLPDYFTLVDRYQFRNVIRGVVDDCVKEHGCNGCIDQAYILEKLEEPMGEKLAEEMRVEYLALLIGLHDDNKEYMLENPDLVDEMLGLYGIKSFDNCKGKCGGHAALNAYSNLIANGVSSASISKAELCETYTLIDFDDPEFFAILDSPENSDNVGLHSTMSIYKGLDSELKARIRNALVDENHPDNWKSVVGTVEPPFISSQDVSILSTNGATIAQGIKIGETTDRMNFEDLDYGDINYTNKECDVLSTLNTNYGVGIFGSYESTGSSVKPSNSIQFSDMRLLLFLTSVSGLMNQTADEFVDEFQENSSNCTSVRWLSVANKVAESNAMKNWIIRFSDQLTARMKIEADKSKIPQSLAISMGDDRPQFSAKHYQNTGLKILINDTEYTQVTYKNYTYDPNSNSFIVDLYVDIEDHFGLDYSDALTYQASAYGLASGFARWWVLQHQREFKPFKQKIYVKATILGKF